MSLELSRFKWTVAKIHSDSFFHKNLSLCDWWQRFFSVGHCVNKNAQTKFEDNASEYVFVYFLLCSWIQSPRRNIIFENCLLISGLWVFICLRVLPPPSGIMGSPAIFLAFPSTIQGPESLVFLGFWGSWVFLGFWVLCSFMRMLFVEWFE